MEQTTAKAIANLQRLAEAFAERRRQLAAGIDLTEAQWRVLEEVGDEDFLPSLFARRSRSRLPPCRGRCGNCSSGVWSAAASARKMGAIDATS